MNTNNDNHSQPSADPTQDNAESSSHRSPESPKNGGASGLNDFFNRLKYLFTGKSKADNDLREVIEEYIEEPQSFNTDSISTHERVLFSNILNLRDVKVQNVMIPRADIAAIDVDITKKDLLTFLSQQHFSRFPVYKDTLDDVMGTIHIKDVLASVANGPEIDLKGIITEIPIVSPSMPILDLVLKMRYTRRHMALVVDEYGGIDGLITIGDVIETIIGEIDDEHDKDDEPQMTEDSDGSVLADARADIEIFEACYGKILSDEEREESDTLGGLVFDVAGRVPVRGEIITHPSGMVFEVLEADARRISRLKIRNIPKKPDQEE